jgi:hypothetical protein
MEIGNIHRGDHKTANGARGKSNPLRGRDSGLAVNFFSGFRSSNGATPAKLFQVSTRLVADPTHTSRRNPPRRRVFAVLFSNRQPPRYARRS